MTTNQENTRSGKWTIWLLLGGILVVTLFLRFWQLDSVPPGWRDDELINSLVISQHVLDGDLAVYYADASGHEALYHVLNAFMLGYFGPGVPGIRWLSVILGTLSVFLTFLVGQRLFGPLHGLVASAALAVSFWSLMYSRTGIRHILLPVLALTTYFYFIRGLGIGEKSARGSREHWLDFLLAGFFMGLSFYSYFASRGVPLILLAFLVYVLIIERLLLKTYWKQILLMFMLALLMAVPLISTLSSQPESEARVSELAVPLIEAGVGNFEPLQEHVVTTLSMFHNTGDDEWLYNIPDRPVFGFLGALYFWLGILIALLYALLPIYNWLFRKEKPEIAYQNSEIRHKTSLSSAFILIWWLAGVSPAFISVPPASLGHTILAQPAVYLIVALPVWYLSQIQNRDLDWLVTVTAVILLAAIAARDIPDYFYEWPQRGMTRFLYRADIREVSEFLNDEPNVTDFAISGLLAGPWDKIALLIGLDDEKEESVNARWYNPQRALMLEPGISFAGFPEVDTPYSEAQVRIPGVDGIGGYHLMQIREETTPQINRPAAPVCFENGLCWIGSYYDSKASHLNLVWAVEKDLQLPEIPLISNPPPPGVYSGPRLLVFAQLQDAGENFLVGDDGLWVDPMSLQAGDRFIQQHYLPVAEDLAGITAVFGLYDPLTKERIMTQDGRDHIRLELEK
jgi:4-amino-4-deoxy-L-arabinose transferase-like glycosyltransferase